MIKEVVGLKVYSTWIDMLQRLVPRGRTHRLAVVVASMLQCAQEMAYEKAESNAKARRLQEIFEEADEQYIEDNIKALLLLAETLFKDAGVPHSRTNSRGRKYSIAEEAVIEFLHWESMPWE